MRRILIFLSNEWTTPSTCHVVQNYTGIVRDRMNITLLVALFLDDKGHGTLITYTTWLVYVLHCTTINFLPEMDGKMQ